MHKQEECNTIVTYNTSHMNNNLNQQNRFKLFSVLKTESRARYRIIYIYISIYTNTGQNLESYDCLICQVIQSQAITDNDLFAVLLHWDYLVAYLSHVSPTPWECHFPLIPHTHP